MKMTLDEIIAATNAKRLHGEASPEILRVSTDTRTLQPGDLFIALVGERFDGHNFLSDAFQKGAAAALVSAAPQSPPAGVVLQVEDTLKALGALAAAWRKRFSLTVTAVTGSVGKTTTKEMLASILASSLSTLKTPENYNNEIGVPLTALQLNGEHQAAVFELAMRGRGQIRYLADIVTPNIAVITNIGVSHLELLDTPRAIAETKAEILENLGADGCAVLPADSEYLPLLQEKAGPARIITFGLNKGEVRAADISPQTVGLSFRLELPPGLTSEKSKTLSIKLSVPGKHNLSNALAAAAAAGCAGASPAQIKRGLEEFMTIEGRSRVLQAPAGFTVIDDAYNASPDSVKAALETLAETPGKGKIAVLGDMLELGDDSPALHRTVGRQAARLDLALLLCVGEQGKEIAAGAADALSSAAIHSVNDAHEALAALSDMVHSGDVVLVKASRALGLEAVVNGLMTLTPKT